MKIPKQCLPVMPYLIVNNAKQFFEFSKSVFGATEQLIVPTEDNKIMHGELKIHDAVIMFADTTDKVKVRTAGMFLYVEDVNKVYEAAVKEGAKILSAPVKKDYGYTAGFEDPYGNQWYIVEGEKES